MPAVIRAVRTADSPSAIGVSPSTTGSTNISTTIAAGEPLRVGPDWIEVAYRGMGGGRFPDCEAFGVRADFDHEGRLWIATLSDRVVP